jgi:enoyl-CoA hydratase
LLDVEHNGDVRVVVLTAAGDRAFCAGMDLTGVGAEKRTEPNAGTARYNLFLSEGFPKPVIAAVNGAAVAGGFELMLACDLAIAADHAVFGLPEVKRGLVAGAGGTLLPLRIPMPVALELALTGNNVTAARAYELGLVNRVVPAADVFPETVRLAESIAANSPGAVRITRDLMYETRERPASELWRHIRAVLPAVLAHPDAVEGSRAFLDKRAPRWTS